MPETAAERGKAQTSTAFGKFFLPGPTEVRAEVLDAMRRPMIGHRGASMEELVARLQSGLKLVFRTERPVYISSSSATGLMEAALRNGARRKVLSLVNGAFSQRFFQIARACGLDVVSLEVPLGAGHTADMLESALRTGDYDAVTVVHSETSTGVLNPVEELCKVTHAAGDVMFLVDSVSGVAGVPVETDDWKIDFLLTGSQKAFALPPGLAFGVAQESILQRAERIPARGVYFDFIEFEKNIKKNQTPNTPSLSLFYALEAQLESILGETLETRWERHAAMARRTWEWVDWMSSSGYELKMLAPEGFRSPTVSCIRLPDGAPTGSEVTRRMKARGFTIASGYGTLKDATFRIGHMGDHTVDELNVLLEELENVLAQ